MRILVVEDDVLVQTVLAEILQEGAYGTPVCTAGYEETERLLDEGADFDLAFLDIQLESALDGVDVAGMLRARTQAKIVFLTSLSDERTVKRAKNLAIDGYIVKPFKPADITTCIALLDLREVTGSAGGDFLVRDGNDYMPLAPESVLYVEAADNYAHVYTAVRRYTINTTMKRMELMLPAHFLRVHRSFIINTQQVNRVGNNYVLIGEREIPVNEEARKVLMNRFRKL